jgi:uncharacterized membrane protein YgdD (TMEM256/DUF423 family)
MIRWAVIAAGISGALAVVLGAFGAHALAATLDARAIEVFETASRYHLLHSVALLGAALAPAAGARRTACAIACTLWLCGLVVFSGSLYLVAGLGLSALGAVTPVGGAGLIGGWVALTIAAGSRGDDS